MIYASPLHFLLSVGQLPPVMLPQGVAEPTLAGAHFHVPILRQPGEHPVGLRDAQRSLEGRLRGGDLTVLRQRLQEFLLLELIIQWPPRTSLQETRDAPGREPDRRHQEEGDHPPQENER